MLMDDCLSTNKLPKHVPPDVTSCAAMRYIGPIRCAAIRHQFVIILTAICAISVAYAHESTLFGLFPTNEPTNEPTKTQEIDERTQESDKRTQAAANEPERTGCRTRLSKAAEDNDLKKLSRSAGNIGQIWRAKTNPRHPRNVE